MSGDLLAVSGLRVSFGAVTAVDDVSFSIGTRETVALVGESGSGKTTLGRAVLGLVRPSAGEILVEGTDTVGFRPAQRRGLARTVQAIFQDPYGSLNPALTIGAILTEPLRVQMKLTKAAARSRVEELLDRVGLPPDAITRYPGHFSGGQRQRVAIARALAISPKLVICDEPTSALDVSTQAQVLDLLAELKEQLDLSYLFITHDLAVVRHFADRVLVMRRGALVESGTPREVCEHPAHPYTQLLVAAAPVPDPAIQRSRRQERLNQLSKISTIGERS